MPQSDTTPRLQKWPFLAGDAALLVAAWLIADNARHPYSGAAIVGIVVCVVAGAVAGAIPFLADYGKRTDDALDERQKALEALSRTTAAAAEQISVATGGTQQFVELAQANLQQAEQVQQHLQNASTEFLSRLATVRTDEKRKLEKDIAALRTAELGRLEAVLDKISQVAAEIGRAQAAPPPPPVPVRVAFAEATADLAAPPEAPAPIASAGESPPAEVAAPFDSRADPVVETAPKPPPRKRAKKLPKPEDSSEAPAAPSPEESEPEVERADPSAPTTSAPPETSPEPPTPSEFSQAAPDEGLPATSVSADGATRLIVTAYIGIGNRLFIRGEGPGLNWDKGTPLQFVSIGKWRWESADASTPVRFKLYKNDDIECTTLAAQLIDPGQQQEVTASF